MAKQSPIFRRAEGPGRAEMRIDIPGDQVCIEHQGVVLTLNVKDEGIEIRWGDDRDHKQMIPFIPTSYQTVLIAKQAPAVLSKAPKKEENTPTPSRIRRVR